MGRCYEFGVSIDPASELAMVVAPEGGHCVCPSTGAVCRGRFAGCTEILAQPGRVPPNAPEWALTTRLAPVAAVAPTTLPAAAPHPPVIAPSPPVTAPSPPMVASPTGPLHGALAAAETRGQIVASHAPAPEAAPAPAAPASPDVAELVATIDALRADVRQLQDRPPAVTVEDLAEAVLLLRNDASATAAAFQETTVDLDPITTALSELREQIDQIDAAGTSQIADLAASFESNLETLADGLTGRFSEILEARLAAVPEPDLSSIEVPVHSIGSAVVTLRGTLAAVVDDVRGITSATEQQIESIRAELTDHTERHARELHALRRQFTEMRTRDEQRQAADVSGRELADHLDQMRSDIARLTDENPGLVTATQLADTINTLRDAGSEEISAAHLVHTFQRDITTLRDEVEHVRATLDLTTQAP